MSNDSKVSVLTAQDFQIAVDQFNKMLFVNGIKPKSKKAKEFTYAFINGLITASLMYKDPLHPAFWIAQLRNDIQELNLEKK